MITAFCRVFLCLALGDVISRLSPWAFPGPVLGLIILFIDLCRIGHVPEMVGSIADRMIQSFGLFFVPAGVGVIAYRQIIQADYLSIALALTMGTLVTIGTTALGAAFIVAILNKRRTSAWTRRS